MIEYREGSSDYFDAANIPVDIWLEPCCDEISSTKQAVVAKYSLKASNYTPRRGFISEGCFEVVSDNKEELQEIVSKVLIPIYENALECLRLMAEGKCECLYYWNKPEQEEQQ